MKRRGFLGKAAALVAAPLVMRKAIEVATAPGDVVTARSGNTLITPDRVVNEANRFFERVIRIGPELAQLKSMDGTLVTIRRAAC